MKNAGTRISVFCIKMQVLCGTPVYAAEKRMPVRIRAKSVGIETVYTDLLPEDKMKIIKGCSDKGEAVCMIGDGVNDALALTSADAGIAMGGIGSVFVAVNAALLLRNRRDASAR